MMLRILGTAAGGGLPQWNCACGGCSAARAVPARRRSHASVALRAAPDRWHVVNATPDLGGQIEAHTDLWPEPGSRRSPVAGVVLTDAELDHTLGIAQLRQAGELRICAAPAVRDALCEHLRLGAVLSPYTGLIWTDLGADKPVRLHPDDAIAFERVPISAKRPRYAASAASTSSAPEDGGWVSALRVTDRESGSTLVYAPALGAWPPALDAAVRSADLAIIDGTFWDDDEPVRAGISTRTATGMGHLPIDGPDGTARRVAGVPGRVLYTHLNNSNPLADPGAPQHRELAALGLATCHDGMVIEL